MFTDTGMFGVYAGTSDKTIDEMLEVSLAAFKACQSDLAQEEIDRAKQQLRAGLLMAGLGFLDDGYDSASSGCVRARI